VAGRKNGRRRVLTMVVVDPRADRARASRPRSGRRRRRGTAQRAASGRRQGNRAGYRRGETFVRTWQQSTEHEPWPGFTLRDREAPMFFAEYGLIPTEAGQPLLKRASLPGIHDGGFGDGVKSRRHSEVRGPSAPGRRGLTLPSIHCCNRRRLVYAPRPGKSNAVTQPLQGTRP
jgi:hypothetical protein